MHSFPWVYSLRLIVYKAYTVTGMYHAVLNNSAIEDLFTLSSYYVFLISVILKSAAVHFVPDGLIFGVFLCLW